MFFHEHERGVVFYPLFSLDSMLRDERHGWKVRKSGVKSSVKSRVKMKIKGEGIG
jgi:hypothetical protein